MSEPCARVPDGSLTVCDPVPRVRNDPCMGACTAGRKGSAMEPPNGNRSYGRVLVGVDGSDTAALAAERAIEVACRWQAELHIVDVVPVPAVAVPVGPAGADAITERLADNDRSAGKALEATRRRATDCGLESRSHLVHGEPARSILSTAEQVGADLIVVGNRGVDHAGRHVLGSVPEAVLLGARCDVLVVHTTDRPHERHG